MSEMNFVSMQDEPEERFNPSELIAKGWQYQDHPQMLKKYWVYLLKGYGERGKDYHMLSEATYEGEEIYMRGQLLLGPSARSNLAEYRKNNALPE